MASTVKSSKASSRKDYTVNYDSAALTTTLQEHKISYFASKDPNIAHYKSIIFTGNLDSADSRNSLEREIQRREDALWDLE